MMKMLLAAAFALSALVVAPIAASAGETCFLCGTGSTNGCQQCRGTDRSACEKKGCKISGTGSCSTAANVKVCKVEKTPDVMPTATEVAVPWCAAK